MTSTPGEWDIVTSVGITALGVAAARAIETHREEPLVSDPYAARFVRAAKPPNPMPTTPAEAAALVDHEGLWVLNSAYMAVRTRFFDDYFRRATDDGVRQAVILAAGLDSRAFRLDWPQGTAIYEVDQPKVLEFKQEVLDEQGATARGTRRTVPVDLRDNWSAALLDAGFVPDEPTAWLAEGLLPYLPPEAEQLLLDTIDKYSGPGSWLSVEQPIDMARMLDDAQVGDVATQWGVDIRSLIHDDARPDAKDTLRSLGWEIVDECAADVARRYGRNLDEELDRMFAVSRYVIGRRAAQ
ncbi:class I SAM-dependent methyltransferase [Amycolatopsis sp. CA-230715]|uniref:class I SAM-dependent methyltransferase n=1 Tax=Amycolatopsis sp. CA-230715 TaxID=2745196 RepID=UPI001C01175F|nr:class I SAM-dependent methyltransferase [Amycolatopsis sp. CA-230715]QWF85010.1 Putative S-adenosyl-L-methionine-dependent methyltransferase [Amycolatopsis sp. CA-230715]